MRRIKDLTGQQFGKLTVIRYSHIDSTGRAVWECHCECGKSVNVKSVNLVRGFTESCGCGRAENLVGKNFGRLTVVERSENGRTSGGRSIVKYLCRCSCGNYVTVRANHLRSGNTKSCGCLNKESTAKRSPTHGLSHERLYNIWQSMKQRCYNSKTEFYMYYGGKGVCVCDEWMSNFESFYNWAIANGYSDSKSIDRIDVNGNYEPLNCRWATSAEQALNRTDNHILEFDKKALTLTEWERETGIHRYTIYSRLERGWSVERALTEPIHK